MDISQMPNRINMNKLWQPTQFQTLDPWTKTLSFSNWMEFENEYGDKEEYSSASNQIIDFYFNNHKVDGMEYTCLYLLMFHPRHTAFRGIIVNGVTISNAHRIHYYLWDHKLISYENFRWVLDLRKSNK